MGGGEFSLGREGDRQALSLSVASFPPGPRENSCASGQFPGLPGILLDALVLSPEWLRVEASQRPGSSQSPPDAFPVCCVVTEGDVSAPLAG